VPGAVTDFGMNDTPAQPALAATHAATVGRAIRIIGLFAFAVWVWRYMHGDAPLLHGSLLIFHEAGHVIFMPFGEFMMVLGGSLFQLMVPAFFVGYFMRRGDPFAACFAGLYLAASLSGTAIYIADARAGELPLLGGDRTSHDWTFLLIELNMLDRDVAIGRFVQNTAITVFWGCLVTGAWLGWHVPARLDAAEPGARPGATV
jgi:hypothetical protein